MAIVCGANNLDDAVITFKNMVVDGNEGLADKLRDEIREAQAKLDSARERNTAIPTQPTPSGNQPLGSPLPGLLNPNVNMSPQPLPVASQRHPGRSALSCKASYTTQSFMASFIANLKYRDMDVRPRMAN